MVNPSSRAAAGPRRPHRSRAASPEPAPYSAYAGSSFQRGNAQVMPEESAGDQDIRVDGVRLLTWRQTAAVSELGRAPVVGPEAGPTSPEGPAVRANQAVPDDSAAHLPGGGVPTERAVLEVRGPAARDGVLAAGGQAEATGRASNFEHGALSWNAATGQVRG